MTTTTIPALDEREELRRQAVRLVERSFGEQTRSRRVRERLTTWLLDAYDELGLRGVHLLLRENLPAWARTKRETRGTTSPLFAFVRALEDNAGDYLERVLPTYHADKLRESCGVERVDLFACFEVEQAQDREDREDEARAWWAANAHEAARRERELLASPAGLNAAGKRRILDQARRDPLALAGAIRLLRQGGTSRMADPELRAAGVAEYDERPGYVVPAWWPEDEKPLERAIRAKLERGWSLTGAEARRLKDLEQDAQLASYLRGPEDEARTVDVQAVRRDRQEQQEPALLPVAVVQEPEEQASAYWSERTMALLAREQRLAATHRDREAFLAALAKLHADPLAWAGALHAIEDGVAGPLDRERFRALGLEAWELAASNLETPAPGVIINEERRA